MKIKSVKINLKNSKNKKLFRKGFSLIEVLVSLTILSVGIVAVMGMFSAGIQTSLTAKSQIIASGLAQELVELVAVESRQWPGSRR